MDFALKALDASAGYCIEGVSNSIAVHSHAQTQAQAAGAGVKGLSFQKEYEDEIMAEQEEYEDDPSPIPPRQTTQIPDSSRFRNYSYGTPIDQQLQNFGHTPSSSYSAPGQNNMTNRRTSMISNNASLDVTNQLPSAANASALNFYMMQQQQGNADDFGTADSWAADMERMHVETEDAAARGYEIGT